LVHNKEGAISFLAAERKMKRKIILLIFLTIFIVHNNCLADMKIIYNSEKGYYEVWDKKLNKLKTIIKDKGYNMKELKVNSFPYQEGFPVLMPRGMEGTFNICDANNDYKKELFIYLYLIKTYMLNYLGEVQDWGDMANEVATCGYIDNDNNLDIIGSFYGAAVRRYDGSMVEGFPYFPGHIIPFYSSSVEDIDRDGNNEIAFGTMTHEPWYYNEGLYVVGSWGGTLPGFPVIFPAGSPIGNDPAASFEVPGIGDFDNDGYMEIAITDARGILNLIKYNGSKFRNWPIGIIYLSIVDHEIPAMADIDNDRKLEIILQDYNKLFAFNEDAPLVEGFPAELDAIPGSVQLSYQSPAIADINEDGSLEMFIADMDGFIYGFSNDGKKLPGWPIDVKNYIYLASFYSNAIVADIDGDGEMEIIAAGGQSVWCSDGILVAFNLDGTLVPGFPIIEEHYRFYSNPLVTDLDNDGDIEICVTSEYCGFYSDVPAYVYCYDLPYPYDKTKIAWGNYAHDYSHTARYVNPKIEAPIVLSISPDSDSFQGGRIVEIKGKYFLPGAKVFFDGIPSEYVQVLDSQTIYANVPPHKPCNMYINHPSVSPYQLSKALANQLVVNDLNFNIMKKANQQNIESLPPDGCIVNVVVAHPSPDQREGVLKAAFRYTGYEPIRDNITLFVSKYFANGTFENQGANWRILASGERKISWNILDDSSDCVPKPYPSGHKVAYYGNKSKCNYDTPGEKNTSFLVSPVVRVDSPDAKLKFKYYRDVEYNPAKYPMRKVDRFSVAISYDSPIPIYTIWEIDSSVPSENKWLEAEVSIGNWVGKGIFISFVFDSVDEIDNAHRGVAIDNVELIGAHYEPWSDDSGEVILNWQGGLPKYFLYRGTNPDFVNNPPELRAYTPFTSLHENCLNDEKSYYYKVR